MSETTNDQTTQTDTVVSAGPAPSVTEAQNVNPAPAPTKWYADEFESLIASKGFKDPNDALKSLTNLERLVGNSVRIPPSDASPEAKADFLAKIKDVEGVLLTSDERLLNKLGKPEKLEDYKLEHLISEDLKKSMPEIGLELDLFKKVAFEAGLTDKQAETIVSMRLESAKQESEAFLASKTKAEETLRTLWGADFENRLGAVKQMASIYTDKFGNDMADLINGPAGNNPALINMMNELAESYKERNHAGMVTTKFGMTPEQALTKISEKRADRGFMEAYNDDRHPGHNKAIEDLQRLYIVSQGG